ncbi:hypothetical protein CYJ73_24910 [Gordonia terrae]|uniref:Uncharacterized protein n=1 Tax=Gordonia terrae TaxID=2055 RepID=A0A2I1R123_9ACTN|nr:hypothetical protein [Gordonia terrae]PKZ62819.1 hypothetical protein CYJ73_24910 [Gordonia terrae]
MEFTALGTLADVAPLKPEAPEAFMQVASNLGWGASILGVVILLGAGLRAAIAKNSGEVTDTVAPLAIGGVILSSVGLVLTLVGPDSDQDRQPTSPDASPVPTPPAPAEPTPSAPEAPTDYTTLWIIGGAVAASLIVIAVAVLAYHKVSQARSHRAVLVKSVRAQWVKAADILGSVDAEYAAYHADLADRLFARPLLDDTNDPRTAAFLDAYTAAHAAAYDSWPLDRDLADRAVATALAARDAWDSASRHARDTGLNIQPAKRGKLTRARKMLDQALDPTITDAYRDNLLDRITTLIAEAGARRIPPVRALVAESVQRQLDTQAKRPQLQR